MLSCSFCGKTQKEITKLLSGMNGVHICDRCVNLSSTILEKEKTPKPKKITPEIKVPIPKDIHAYLDEHIIGQDRAKKSISVAIYNHYKRILKGSETPIQKNNVLFVGPTGVGKTLIAKTIAKLLQVPFVVTDATTLTESGYAGDDTEVLINRLMQDCNNDVELAQKGIIFVDEIDKKAKRNDYANLSRDVSGEGVQQSLLKLMEGTTVNIYSREQGQNTLTAQVDTTDILFIVSGAFVGLDDVVMQRLGKQKIGFNSVKISTGEMPLWEKHLETQDLIKYGLIPEFVGRLPSVTVLNKLNTQDLFKVLTEPKYSIVNQYKALFELDGIQLEFNDNALMAVVEKTEEQDLGARGLHKILDDVLMEVQYELPDLAKQGVEKIVITKQTVKFGESPWFIHKGDNKDV